MMNRDFAPYFQLPVTPIGKLRPGPAIVRGRVTKGSEVTASTLSKTPCVYHWFRAEKQYPSGDGSASRLIGTSAWRADVLYVADETGTTTVPLERADLLLQVKAYGTGPVLPDPPEGFRQVLCQQYGVAVPERTWFGTHYIFEECVLAVGDEVFVAGAVALHDRHPFFFKQGSVLLVSDYDEAKFYRTLWWRTWWRLFQIVGVLVAIVMVALLVLGWIWNAMELVGFAFFVIIADLIWYTIMTVKVHGMKTLERS